MALTIRPFESGDEDGFWRVGDLTYNNGIPTPPEKRVLKNRRGFVAVLDGEIAGIFSVVDFTCTREAAANPKCAGIAGVAVSPSHRHLGIGSEMMRWSIPHLKAEGYQIASLYGFRESFYRKFGYEVCGLRLEIEAPSHRFPRLKPELAPRTLDWQNHAPLQECHTTFAKRYSGMNIRNDMHWSRVLDDKKTIYAVGDPVEAYAIVQHDWDFWVTQRINEVAWSTMRGYRSIVAVLSQIGINKTSLVWYEPSDSPFLQFYSDQGIIAKSSRPIMYRLLDVPGALTSLEGVGAGAFSFEVQDELLPENNGPWRVESDGASVKCTRVDSADLTGSIQSWTQAYLGDPGIDRGAIEERESGALASARAVLPDTRAYCMEFF